MKLSIEWLALIKNETKVENFPPIEFFFKVGLILILASHFL